MSTLIKGNQGQSRRISSSSVRTPILLLAACVAVMAQVYPGGGYPGHITRTMFDPEARLNPGKVLPTGRGCLETRQAALTSPAAWV